MNILSQTKFNLREKLLAYFFTNPEANLYVREIASIIEADPGNLSKELQKLEKEGVFLSYERGKEKYFSLNKNYPIYKELKSIVFKTIGVRGALLEALKPIQGILFAFIYGSYAKGKEGASSDIDLCLVVRKDNFNEEVFLERINEMEKKFAREINYAYYQEDEWQKKIHNRDSFVHNILSKPKIMLVGGESELRRFSKRR